MQKISIESLEPGMQTHGRVHSAEGKVLLGHNVEVTENYIQRVKNLGVSTIFIKNPLIEEIGIHYEETLSEEKKIQAVRMLKEAFDEATAGRSLNIYSLARLANLIIDSVRRHQIIRLDNSVTQEDYIYLHCVNVAALVAVIAYDMDYTQQKLHELVTGALVHDIGTAMILKDNPEATAEQLQGHAQRGFDYVRTLRGFSVLSAHVVFQHHEHYDGSGYPRKLKELEIHEYARITAIANAYDSMVADAPGKHGLLPHEAYEAIMAKSVKEFDSEIARIFLAKVPLYPIGTFVQLNIGYIGVVTEALPKLQQRPKVMIICDRKGKFVSRRVEIDLTADLTTFIEHVLSEQEVIWLTNSYHK